jgi:endonuclease G
MARTMAWFLAGSLVLSGCRKEEPVEPEVPAADPGTATRDAHLALGNPSGAVPSVVVPDNYLLVKSQYVLAYDNSRGTAKWVAWHLSSAWKGAAPRCNCYAMDQSLPTSFFRAVSSDYTNSGFDRGHMCPSEDRDASDADNEATFRMSNMMPQAPRLNQITWLGLEDYSRELMAQGQELYILAGGYGSGGVGSSLNTTQTIAGGDITVPSRYWKVLVVLPVGSDDLQRISTATRVIAVDMPNTQTADDLPWYSYRTSVDAIEDSTGLDLLSLVPASVQGALEANVDSGPTQ